MAKATFEVRDDLYCPECAQVGMRPLSHKAESGRTRYKCVSCGHRTTNTIYTPPQLLPKTKVTEIKRHRRFIITSAVNDTPLVAEAHKTFERMARELDACYLIIPGRYKNPNMVSQGIQQNYTWPEEIMPYLCNADIELNRHLAIRALFPIQYTAVNPLGGMNHAGDTRSEIFGHPQIVMQLVATAKDKIPKMLHTTGSISIKNYSSSKMGKKAEFHHSIGAVFVEIEGDKFWPTQLRYDGTGVHLFDRYYTPRSSRKVHKVPGIVFGDTHVRSLTKKTITQLDQVCSALKPDYEVYHDLHDHHIGSHHNDKNTIFHLKKSLTKEFSVRDELMLSVKFLKDRNKAVLIDSNHHRHLDQWFNRFNPNRDPVNLELYYELASMARDDLSNGGDGNLYRLFIEKYSQTPVRFVEGNESFEIEGIDCSQHGDVGPNGSRGSAKSFSKTGNKTIIGHSHTPAIEKGCYQVGTSAMDLDYAVGYSSWMNTHCIIYPNGKRALFSLVKDKLSPLMRKLGQDV